MMPPYRVFVRIEAAEFLRTIRGPERRAITLFVTTLSEDPNLAGDYVESDGEGRDIEIKVIGEFAITYWSDHAAKEVKIVDVRRADRA